MTLRLPDKWVWDFWLVQDGPDYHIFYLQALKSLKDDSLRHWHVSVGHAVSTDLENWQILPNALHPSDEEDAWDNKTTWTGSILKHEETWYFFYTGSTKKENGLVQRIGLATSTDLLHWEKHPQSPVIEAESQWYEMFDLDLWHDQSWRDPWVFQHPTSGEFHAFITGRVNYGPTDGRGVIAHAQSQDLLNWEVLPPVTGSGEFGVMEVPQLVEINGRFYLIFCAWADIHAAHRNKRLGSPPVTGTHYLVADNPLGPFTYTTDNFLAGDVAGSLYSGKLVQNPQGAWCFIAFRNFDEDGNFIGEIIDPIPITVDKFGNLHLQK